MLYKHISGSGALHLHGVLERGKEGIGDLVQIDLGSRAQALHGVLPTSIDIYTSRTYQDMQWRKNQE
jgi:hypothetical protein